MCNNVNKNKVKKYGNRTSGQDRGIGRYILPPHTTKRRTTNLKTKNSQNCQKIELYESLTTKELKKKYSSRLVGGGVEMESWDGEKVVAGESGEVVAGGSGSPIFVCR